MLNQWGRLAPTAVGETFPHSHNLPPGSRDLLLQGFSENVLWGEGSWEQIKCRMVSPKRDSFRQRHATYTDGGDRQGAPASPGKYLVQLHVGDEICPGTITVRSDPMHPGSK